MTDQAAIIQKLADESEIRRMLAFYTDAVNHADPARATSVYADDAWLISQGLEFHTRAEITLRLSSMFAKYRLIHQVAHSSLIEINGDTANSRTSLYEVGIEKETQQVTVFIGEMEDQWAKLPEGWRFKRRTLHMMGRGSFELDRLQTVDSIPLTMALAI